MIESIQGGTIELEAMPCEPGPREVRLRCLEAAARRGEPTVGATLTAARQFVAFVEEDGEMKLPLVGSVQ